MSFVKLQNYYEQTEEYRVLANFLADLSNPKPSRLLSNPHYTKLKIIRCLIESLNRLEENKAVILNNISQHPINFDFTLQSLHVSLYE